MTMTVEERARKMLLVLLSGQELPSRMDVVVETILAAEQEAENLGYLRGLKDSAAAGEKLFAAAEQRGAQQAVIRERAELMQALDDGNLVQVLCGRTGSPIPAGARD